MQCVKEITLPAFEDPRLDLKQHSEKKREKQTQQHENDTEVKLIRVKYINH